MTVLKCTFVAGILTNAPVYSFQRKGGLDHLFWGNNSKGGVGGRALSRNTFCSLVAGIILTTYKGRSAASQGGQGRQGKRFLMLGPWRCSGGSNTELVNNLHDAGILQSRRAIEAMEATNRVHYSPDRPFEDRPQYIGYDATISAPHMHAHALELLGDVIPEHNAKVLDVGCGSGYLTAAFARLAGKDAVIYGMDYIPGLVELSLANIVKDDKDLLDSGRVCLKVWYNVAALIAHGAGIVLFGMVQSCLVPV
ncbi:unnamed protein product [Discosporangium mesarthrocarpum]